MAIRSYLFNFIREQIQFMKKRSESEPKLRQVYTSRIKDGRRSNDFSPVKNNYMSAQKLSSSHIYNPQSVHPKIKEKCHHNKPHYTPNNTYDKLDIVQTQAQSPVKRISDFQPSKITKYQDRKQETYNGRKLQYPHESYRNAGYYPVTKQKEAKKNIERPQSARYQSTSSKHFVDRTQKSRQKIQKQTIDEEKMKVAINYLLENNNDYLDERSRVCVMKARPKQQIFKIQLANTQSTYKQHYPPKKAEHQIYMEPQNQKTALSLGPRKVTGNSTTHEFHNGRQGPKADLATWPDGFKLEGPMDGTTTYLNHFPNYGEHDKMVPIAVFNQHPMGMPFNTISTQQDHFRGEYYPASEMATWNNMNPYGNDFDPNRSTTYRSFHNSKQKQEIQQWPNYDPRLLVSKGKFSTEYKSEMTNKNEQQLNHGNYCQCSWHRGRSGRKRIYN